MVRLRDFETWLVEVFRQHPSLDVELVRHIGTFALPEEVTAVLGSDMADVAHEHLEDLMAISYRDASLTAGTSRASPLARHAARKRPGRRQS